LFLLFFNFRTMADYGTLLSGIPKKCPEYLTQ
jgi:hypothetical protein